MSYTKHEAFEAILFAASQLLRQLNESNQHPPTAAKIWLLGWTMTIFCEESVRSRFRQDDGTYDLPLVDVEELRALAKHYDAWVETVCEDGEFDALHQEYWDSLVEYWDCLIEA